MHSLVIFTILLASVCLVYANSVPFEIRKCKSTDPKCLKSVTQELIPKVAPGLPVFNIKPLDPMEIEKVDASSPNLKLILTKLKVKGLKDCIAKKLERDPLKKMFAITLQCTTETVGNYEMKGQVLVVPFEGNDKFEVKLFKTIFKVEGTYDFINKDGKAYWDIKNWDFAYKLQEKSVIKFFNLFNGNKALAQAANEVIDGNSNEVVNEIGVPVIKAIVTRIVDTLRLFFLAIPAEDLAIDI